MATYVIRMHTDERDARGVPIERGELDWGGVTYRASGSGFEMALARLVLAQGVPDGPWLGVDYLTGKARLQGASLRRLSELTVSEPASGKNRGFRRWEARPKAVLVLAAAAPLLAASCEQLRPHVDTARDALRVFCMLHRAEIISSVLLTAEQRQAGEVVCGALGMRLGRD